MVSTAIAVEDPRQPEVESMLREGADFALALYPPEGCFLLDLDELAAPGVSVYIVRDAGHEAVGMAALVDNGDGTAELKRMFVRDAARGRGIASALLDTLESAARASGHRAIVLETGTLHTAALALYAKHGYERIPAFGPYAASEFSICMQKNLA